jgi:hypothetical protein
LTPGPGDHFNFVRIPADSNRGANTLLTTEIEEEPGYLPSDNWKRWFGVENRCLVPVTSFAEPDPASQEQGSNVPNAWFARDATKPLMFFAGIHVPQWQSVRRSGTG